MKIIESQAKEIFTKTKLPGADRVINQYVGCKHNCSYCYAKFMARWKKHGPWGSWVEVKINAQELVRNRYVPGWVFMSSVSDPYQPIEKKLRLTRHILENMDKNIKLSILTKSDLVLRDLDLFKQFKTIEVGLTINSFDGKLKKLFEPKSPTNQQRIQTLKILKQNGLRTYVFISPIIPGLIDIAEIIRKTKPSADSYWLEFLNLRGAGREFEKILKTKFSQSYQILKDEIFFEKYLNDLRRIISRAKINIQGIETH